MRRQLALALTLTCLPAALYAGQKFSMTQSLEDYIREARANAAPLQTSQGSLYTDAGINADLYSDRKAHRVNDIVTVRIQESTQAESAADAQTGRSSSLSLGVPNLFNLESHNKIPLENLVNANTDMQFKGNGTTQRSGSVVAFLAARVKEVLPNGDMVIEGAKEIKVNNERQMLRLFGVIRARDVGPTNIVLSTSIANMLVQVDGKGVLSDSIRQGWLLGMITKIWPF
jgi:flagellar L-ring protein precursor FlgH